MCGNIKQLFNFDPPATEAEVRNASLQFVRKIAGASKPSQKNAPAFEQAVDEITASCQRLLESMVTTAPPKDRETEMLKAQERSRKRFAT